MSSMHLVRFALASLLVGSSFLVGGCYFGDDPIDGPGSIVKQSGFYRIDPIQYLFHNDISNSDYRYTTTQANLWYSFHPADKELLDGSKVKPVFVMLNGGPGAATSANLFALNTAPYTLSADWVPNGGPTYKVNEFSWTRLGHLLYIDPAQTGFSYNVNANAADNAIERGADYFTRGNFNPFIDADQVLRLVLRFLSDHPELRGNPVVFVGESYGGTRVSTMLNLLLFSERYAANGSSFFRDDGLVTEIKKHFRALGKTVEPLSIGTVAAQFGHQVLIQPQLSGRRQDDVQAEMYWTTNPSIIDEIAQEAGYPGGFTRNDRECGLLQSHATCPIMTYLPRFNRDRYNYKKPKTWSDDLELFSATTLTQLGSLNTVLGVDVGQNALIKATARAGSAYHVFLDLPISGFDEAMQQQSSSLMPGLLASQAYKNARMLAAPYPEDDSLEKNFGRLGPNDRYYITMNTEVYAAFSLNILSPEYLYLPLNADNHSTYGDFFLENARHVKTFLTDAKFDVVIYSPALPVALKRHTNQVKDIVWQRGEATTDRNQLGQFDIQYLDDSKVSLFYPYYGTSGHAVGATEPKKLRDDVGDWLACTATGGC